MASRRIKVSRVVSSTTCFVSASLSSPPLTSTRHSCTQGIAIQRPIVYGNTAVFLLPSERTNPEHTHRWTVAVRSAASPPPGKRGEVQQVGGLDDISYFVKKVSFKLHETYPNPNRGRSGGDERLPRDHRGCLS